MQFDKYYSKTKTQYIGVSQHYILQNIKFPNKSITHSHYTQRMKNIVDMLLFSKNNTIC